MAHLQIKPFAAPWRGESEVSPRQLANLILALLVHNAPVNSSTRPTFRRCHRLLHPPFLPVRRHRCDYVSPIRSLETEREVFRVFAREDPADKAVASRGRSVEREGDRRAPSIVGRTAIFGEHLAEELENYIGTWSLGSTVEGGRMALRGHWQATFSAHHVYLLLLRFRWAQ